MYSVYSKPPKLYLRLPKAEILQKDKKKKPTEMLDLKIYSCAAPLKVLFLLSPSHQMRITF